MYEHNLACRATEVVIPPLQGTKLMQVIGAWLPIPASDAILFDQYMDAHSSGQEHAPYTTPPRTKQADKSSPHKPPIPSQHTHPHC
jgi:hypothetical protein